VHLTVIVLGQNKLSNSAPRPQVVASRILEALPLPVFLLSMALLQPATPDEWRGPYFASTTAAVVGSFAVIVSGLTLNRIHLGLALYYLSGAIGLALGLHALNEFYGRAEATAMLYWILAVGVVTAVATRTGFLGVPDTDLQSQRRHSVMLLGVLIAAIAFSWAFHERPLMAAYAPFLAVFFAHAVLRARLLRAASRSPR
jgi:hypothetical protein